jgi:hypothetical protein
MCRAVWSTRGVRGWTRQRMRLQFVSQRISWPVARTCPVAKALNLNPLRTIRSLFQSKNMISIALHICFIRVGLINAVGAALKLWPVRSSNIELSSFYGNWMQRNIFDKARPLKLLYCQLYPVDNFTCSFSQRGLYSPHNFCLALKNCLIPWIHVWLYHVN